MIDPDLGSAQTDYATFRERARTHSVVPVMRRVFADNLGPLDVYRKLAQGRPGTFLLESAEQDGIWSRFSFVGLSSFGVLTTDARGASRWIPHLLGVQEAFAGSEMPGSPLAAVDELARIWHTPRIPGLPSLTSGLIGYIGWEAVRQLEHLPDPKPEEVSLPSQSLSFVRELAVIDHRYNTVTLVHNVLAGHHAADGAFVSSDDAQLEEAWTTANAGLDDLVRRLSAPTSASVEAADFDAEMRPEHRTTREDFLAAVERAKEYVRIGDVFQVVIGQRFELATTADPIDVYRVLRTLNPSPYMYLMEHVDAEGVPFSVVGSSPEALVKVTDGTVITHPIAGSRPRGQTPEADQRLSTELLADEKERAEHLMLVDLSRNDLSRVCAPGSVGVAEFMTIERYSHIMHIVSTVTGRLEPQYSAVDVFRATFPAGTLSGAPKPRALEIIDELEPAQRGVYAGVVGYFDFAGDTDLAIAIRTAVIKDGRAYVQAGAGIVADSVPETEYQETVNKATAPLRAVAVANTLRPLGGESDR